MGIDIAAGRPFEAMDREGGRRVAMVNQTMAEKYWGGASAVGHVPSGSPVDDEAFEVVGVARDIKYATLGEDPSPYVYFPLAQFFDTNVSLHVRTAVGARSPAADRHPRDPGSRWRAGDHEPARHGRRGPPIALGRNHRRFLPGCLRDRGAAARGDRHLRGREPDGAAASARAGHPHRAGCASRSEVMGLVLRRGMLQVATGGRRRHVALAASTTHLLQSLLYGLTGTEPVAFLAAALLLSAIAFVACLIPGRSATRVDPMTTLRES